MTEQELRDGLSKLIEKYEDDSGIIIGCVLSFLPSNPLDATHYGWNGEKFEKGEMIA